MKIIKTHPDIQGPPTIPPSFPSEDFAAIGYGTPVMSNILLCFCDGHCIIFFLIYNGFQILLFVSQAVCRRKCCVWMNFSWLNGFTIFLQEEVLIPTFLFSGIPVATNPPVTLATMWLPIPYLHQYRKLTNLTSTPLWCFYENCEEL